MARLSPISICLLLMAAMIDCQRIASQYFSSDQITLWQGNTLTQHVHAPTSYQFAYTIQLAPTGVDRIFAALAGYSLQNGNTLNYYVNLLYSYTSNGTFTVDFNPMASSIYYSISFSLLVGTALPNQFMYIDRYNLNPSVLSNSSRTAGNDAEIFTLTSGRLFSHANFKVRVFISYMNVEQYGGELGLSLPSSATYTVNTYDFTVLVGVIPYVVVHSCSIVVIIIDSSLMHSDKHMDYTADTFRVSNNFQTNPNVPLSSHTSSNFGINALFGPIYSRNCTIGIYQTHMTADTTQKDLLFDYNTTSGFLNIQDSTTGSGGFLAYYQVFCLIDCHQSAFYYSTTSQCEYCNFFMTYCESCINSTYCTNCGVNTFYDPLYKQCRCKFGNRVVGGCTTIQGCSEISTSNTCLQCFTGYTLATNNLSCLCDAGFTMVTSVCVNATGCIAAATIHNLTRCLSCNDSMHLVIDVTTHQCVCVDGFTKLNGICVTICGNGRLYDYEQCDDGNHADGDGCSSNCIVESHYDCLTNSSASICVYKTQQASISLVEVYRDNKQNAGYFIFQIKPAIKNLDKMNFPSAINFTCDSNISRPEISYSDGILKIKVIYSQDLENKVANVTLTFNQSIIKHKPISDIFVIRSMNSPLLIFKKFPEYNTIVSFLFYVSLVAVCLFVLGSWAHKMIGVQTLHVFQLIFVLNIYEVCYSDLFLSSLQTLRFTSNYSDIFFDQLRSIKENGVYESLRFAFTFIQNYYIVGSVEIIIFIIFLINFIRYLITVDGVTNETQIKIIEHGHKRRKEVVYSIFLFPVVVGYFYQCFFASQAQNLRKLHDKLSIEYLFNAFMLITFLMASSMIVFREFSTNLTAIPLFFKYFRFKNKYISLYIFNLLANIVLLNISEIFQHDIILLLAWNITYLLILAIYRPYKHHIHNFTICMHQFIIIYWNCIILFQDLSHQSMTQDSKYIALAILLAFLSMVCLFALIRILLEVVENGSHHTKISNQFKETQSELKDVSIRVKEANINLERVLDMDVQQMNKYRVESQQKMTKRRYQNEINSVRMGKNMVELFPIEIVKKMEVIEEAKEELEDYSNIFNYSSQQSHSTKKDIEETKRQLRQKLIEYRKKYQEERKSDKDVREE